MTSTGDVEELLKEGDSLEKKKLSTGGIQKVGNLPLRQSGRLAAAKKGVLVHHDQLSCSHSHGLDEWASSSEQAETVSLCHIQHMGNSKMKEEGIRTPDNISQEDQSSLLDASSSVLKQAEKEIGAGGIMEILPKEGCTPCRRSARLRLSAAKKKN